MASKVMFDLFDGGFYIEQKNIRSVELYILSNLNAIHTPSRGYWEKQYHLCNKLYIVSYWRKRHNLPPIAKNGETTCNNELINYYSNKAHQHCICSK